MRKLPPFDTLLAFEAVARRLSMTVAAEELSLTQSAISHRIRRLEEFMDAPLFDRSGSRLCLTRAGLALQRELGDIIIKMGALRDRVLLADSPKTLRVGVGAALADNWLIRRLPSFNLLHPEATIELVALSNEAPELVSELDIRILWKPVSEAHVSATQVPLFREHVFPVCSPSLLSDGNSCNADVLRELPLLEKRAPGYQSGMEWSWQFWFDQLMLGEPGRPAMCFSSIGPVVSAAIQGNGVGLVRSMLACDALEDGRLVRVLSPEHDLLSSKVHVVSWRESLCDSMQIYAFVDWLRDETSKTSVYVAPGPSPVDSNLQAASEAE